MAILFLLLLSTLLIVSILFSAKRRSLPNRRPPFPPGPKGWPVLGNLPQLGSKPHQTLHSLSQKYGPLLGLRLGHVHVVVASSASTAAMFFRTHDANFSSRPPNSGAEHVAYNYQDLVFAPYGERWRMLRRLCALNLFSAKAMEDFGHVRAGEVARLVWGLKTAQAAVNVGGEVNECATNALSLVLLGRRVFGGRRDEDQAAAEEFKELVVELMKLAGVFNVGDFVHGLGWLDLQGVVSKMKKLHKKMDKYFCKIMEEHKEKDDGNGKASRDVLSIFMKLKDESNEDGGFTDTHIKALLLNLFTAGTDTTSSTVEWALAELIQQPSLMAEAQAEIDSIAGRSRLVSESDLPNLPLLRAIVKETLRLHPSTPLSLPRVAAEGCEIAGYSIPKGATLLVNIWAISRDPSSWPEEPLAFRPERFLAGGFHEGVDVKGGDFELIPFGAGRRICAGMSLGLRMVQFMTATLVHAFDWRLGEAAGKLDMEEAYGLTLRRATPLVAIPVPRLTSQAYPKHAY
ncbi:Flavonoid 3'-monooxygenase [Platanthera zijinensis]|uniref:Flavonoid 3'-monooxygenase n=1 Tax=Platanthera zijinensis TaxID=2320716 RepID=A0AAP0B9X3_9ASPA